MNRAFPWLELDDDRKSTLPIAQKSKASARGFALTLRTE